MKVCADPVGQLILALQRIEMPVPLSSWRPAHSVSISRQLDTVDTMKFLLWNVYRSHDRQLLFEYYWSLEAGSVNCVSTVESNAS